MYDKRPFQSKLHTVMLLNIISSIQLQVWVYLWSNQTNIPLFFVRAKFLKAITVHNCMILLQFNQNRWLF